MPPAKPGRGVLLQASARSDGDLRLMVDHLAVQTGWPVIDLREKRIGHFDYAFLNQDDDFPPLIEAIIRDYELIVFATPVYWYTMSGLLKVFFDRMSDLLLIRKELGRQLRGKLVAVVSCAYDRQLKPGFHMPFVETARYLGMHYLGDVHGWIEQGAIPPEVEQRLDAFLRQLEKESARMAKDGFL